MYRDYQNLYNEFAKYGFDKNIIDENGGFDKLLERVRPKQRNAIEIKYCKGVSYAETGRITGTSIENARALIFRGFRIIMSYLTIKKVEKETGVDPEKASILNLNLSSRAYNALWRSNCKTIHDVAVLSDEQLINTRGCGEKCFSEIKSALRKYLENTNTEKES